MPQPALGQIEGHPRLQGADAECMAKATGASLATHNTGKAHHAFDMPPSRDPAPRPQAMICALRIPLHDRKAEVLVDLCHQFGRDWHLANAMFSALQCLKRDNAALNLESGWSEGKNFRNARARPGQQKRKERSIPRLLFHFSERAAALSRIQIFPSASRGIQAEIFGIIFHHDLQARP
jgi:hypothetical protein